MSEIKLVLVDNNSIFREGLRQVLERDFNIKVVGMCSCGSKIIECIYNHHANVVITDHESPGCIMINTIRRIHEMLPEVAIIILAHSELDEDVISAFGAGATGYLSKNTRPQDIATAIILATRGGLVVSPPMSVRLLHILASLNTWDVIYTMKNGSLLSKREKEIISLVSQGLTNKQIADALCISPHTVKVHLQNVMGKFNVHSRHQAVVLAKQKDIIASFLHSKYQPLKSVRCSTRLDHDPDYRIPSETLNPGTPY